MAIKFSKWGKGSCRSEGYRNMRIFWSRGKILSVNNDFVIWGWDKRTVETSKGGKSKGRGEEWIGRRG